MCMVLSHERKINSRKLMKKTLLQNEILIKVPAFQQILRKEYQYRYLYQGQYPNEHGVYGSWFFESILDSEKPHLEVFNNFRYVKK